VGGVEADEELGRDTRRELNDLFGKRIGSERPAVDELEWPSPNLQHRHVAAEFGAPLDQAEHTDMRERAQHIREHLDCPGRSFAVDLVHDPPAHRP